MLLTVAFAPMGIESWLGYFLTRAIFNSFGTTLVFTCRKLLENQSTYSIPVSDCSSLWENIFDTTSPLSDGSASRQRCGLNYLRSPFSLTPRICCKALGFLVVKLSITGILACSAVVQTFCPYHLNVGFFVLRASSYETKDSIEVVFDLECQIPVSHRVRMDQCKGWECCGNVLPELWSITGWLYMPSGAD